MSNLEKLPDEKIQLGEFGVSSKIFRGEFKLTREKM